MRTISVINHKGGVGKTTFTGCLAQALALTGFRTLVIDNDSQHNLSAMFGCRVASPNIRDVYCSFGRKRYHLFLKAIRKTEINNLHLITSSYKLCASDIKDINILARCITNCNLNRFYDYLLIDNAPGMDKLQMLTLVAADDLFVPTELKQFAIDGIVEMERVLTSQFSGSKKISRIIPNYYKNTKRQNTYISVLHKLFPGKVTQTPIPVDPVFDELITEEKILFLHRLYSKGAAFYLKIMHELFNLDEENIWEAMMEKRNQRLREEARERFLKHRHNRQNNL